MDLKQIAYFTWIVEEGTIAGAAKKANVVPPAISMQIKRLEDELATKLLQRGPRGVTPTEAGRRFYDHCIRIAEQISHAKHDIVGQNASGELDTKLRIGLTPVLSGSVLVPAVERFQERYPKVRLSLTEAYTGSVFEAVLSGEVDFAFGVTQAAVPGLSQRTIGSDEVVLLSGRPLAGRQPYDTIDLTTETDLDLIVPSEKHSFGGLLQSYMESGIIKPRKIIEIDGAVAAHNLIRRSDWVLISPHLTRCNAQSDDLYAYRIGTPLIPFTISLLHDHRRPLGVASAQFVRMVEEELAGVARSSGAAGPVAMPRRRQKRSSKIF